MRNELHEEDAVYEFLEDLSRTQLFSGIAPQEIAGLLVCLRARRVEYAEGDFIVEEGSEVQDCGILLSGRGRAIKWDPSGRLILLTLLKKGSEVGVMVAAASNPISPVTVQAQSDVTLLQMPFGRVWARCEKACSRHDRLLRNYIGIVADKGLVLHERLDCLLRPTVREKIYAYLSRASREAQSRTFDLPMNRNAMAEYLNVERSALSRELSAMKRDGKIAYHKNAFRLL